jgi:5-methylcytosine-specific restriction endonuclease McrA
MDFGFKPYKIKPIKIQKIKVERIHQTKMGDRTLTPAQKRKIKEDQSFKCAKCGKKTDPRYLDIHHKKEIHKHKSPSGYDMPVMTIGKKYKPKYDRRHNLEAICIKCHDKTKKVGKRKNPYEIGGLI